MKAGIRGREGQYQLEICSRCRHKGGSSSISSSTSCKLAVLSAIFPSILRLLQHASAGEMINHGAAIDHKRFQELALHAINRLGSQSAGISVGQRGNDILCDALFLRISCCTSGCEFR